MTFKYGMAPGGPNTPLSHSRLTIPSGLMLTTISGGSVDIANAADGSDILSSLTVGGVEQLSSAVTWATDDATFMRTIVRNINANADATCWATHDGTSKVLLWLKDAAASSTAAVSGTAVSFTPTYVNMNTEQAFVAARRWNSGNEGTDGVAAVMYLATFDMSHLSSLDSEWTLTTAKGVELVLTTEDQVLSVYIGSAGVITIGASAESKTLGVFGVAQGHINMFMQSAAAQNPTYLVRAY